MYNSLKLKFNFKKKMAWSINGCLISPPRRAINSTGTKSAWLAFPGTLSGLLNDLRSLSLLLDPILADDLGLVSLKHNAREENFKPLSRNKWQLPGKVYPCRQCYFEHFSLKIHHYIAKAKGNLEPITPRGKNLCFLTLKEGKIQKAKGEPWRPNSRIFDICSEVKKKSWGTSGGPFLYVSEQFFKKH